MGIERQQVQPIPYEFKLLLDGDSYTYSNDLVIPSSTSVDFHILCGTEKDTIISVAQADVFGTETAFFGFANSTVSDNGTEIFAKSHNVQLSKTSGTRLFSSPAVTSDGDLIATAVAYAANQPGKIALADTSILSKYVLVRGSSNIMRITNRSTTASTKVSMFLDFIEVDI